MDCITYITHSQKLYDEDAHSFLLIFCIEDSLIHQTIAHFHFPDYGLCFLECQYPLSSAISGIYNLVNAKLIWTQTQNDRGVGCLYFIQIECNIRRAEHLRGGHQIICIPINIARRSLESSHYLFTRFL